MQITCPACQATYEVPDRLIAPGRRVRCAKCGENWLPAPAEPETPMEAVLAAMAEAALGQGGASQAAAGQGADGGAAGQLGGAGAGEAAGASPTLFPTLPPEEWPADAPPPAAPPSLPSHAGPHGAGKGHRSPWPLRLAWAASVLLLLGLGTAGWLYRIPVVVAWPPAMRIFALLGSLPGG